MVLQKRQAFNGQPNTLQVAQTHLGHIDIDATLRNVSIGWEEMNAPHSPRCSSLNKNPARALESSVCR